MEVYDCPVCAASFRDIDAYCEDWNIPAKSFGCPKCETLLNRLDNRVVNTRAVWFCTIPTILIGFVISLSASLFGPALNEPHFLAFAGLHALGIIIACSSYAIWRSFWTKRFGPNCRLQ